MQLTTILRLAMTMAIILITWPNTNAKSMVTNKMRNTTNDVRMITMAITLTQMALPPTTTRMTDDTDIAMVMARMTPTTTRAPSQHHQASDSVMAMKAAA